MQITVPSPDPFQTSIFGGLIIFIVASVVAITIWVYKIGYPEIRKGQTIKPQIGVIILVILAILSPEAIRVYSDPPSIFLVAMWLNTISIVLEGYSFNASFFLVAIPLTLLRLVYPLMMYRYYRSKTSRSYVIIAGVLVEVPMLIFGYPLLIPLIFGLVTLGLVPVPQRPVSWPEPEESSEEDEHVESHSQQSPF